MTTETRGTHSEPHSHHHHHEIHFFVDGEPFETGQREWTPNAIIRKFGEKDPAIHYLVRIEGHHSHSYQGRGRSQSKSTAARDFRSYRRGRPRFRKA